MDVMNETDFARFEFKMIFGGVSYIRQVIDSFKNYLGPSLGSN